jgi:rubredoxin
MSTIKFQCRVCGSSSYEHPLTLISPTRKFMERDADTFKCRKCGAMYRKAQPKSKP